MTEGVGLDEELEVDLVLELAELLPAIFHGGFGGTGGDGGPARVPDEAVAELPCESRVLLLVGDDLRAAGEETAVGLLPAGVQGEQLRPRVCQNLLPALVIEVLHGELGSPVVRRRRRTLGCPGGGERQPLQDGS